MDFKYTTFCFILFIKLEKYSNLVWNIKSVYFIVH